MRRIEDSWIAEEHVLGACMMHRSAIEWALATGLVPSEFDRRSHGLIFETMVGITERGDPVDPIVVVAELERLGRLDEIGGSDRIRELASLVPAAANVAHYARIVRTNATSRALLFMLTPLVRGMENGGFDPDAATAVLELAMARLAAGSSVDDASWLLDAAELLSRPDPGPTRWLIDDLIVNGAIVAAVGRWKTMKTFVMLDLAISVATGYPALGRFGVPTPGPVVYVIEESGEDALYRRLDQLRRGRGIEREELRGKLFVSANKGVKLDDPVWQRRLLVECGAIRPRLVVFDPLARMKAADRDENAQTDVAVVIEFLRQLRERSGSAVAIVHHTGHNGDRMRGSSDLESVWETRLSWKREESSAVVTLSAEHREAEGLPVIKIDALWERDTGTIRFNAKNDVSADRMIRDLDPLILDHLGEHPDGRTATEIGNKTVGGIGVNRALVEEHLERLVASGAVLTQIGGEGRRSNAALFRLPVSALGQAQTGDHAGTSACLPEEPPLSPVGGEGSGTGLHDPCLDKTDGRT